MAFLRPFVSRALGALACVALLTVTAPLAPVPYAGVARAADEDPVVARVNGVDIRQSDLAFAEEEIGAQYADDTAGAEARLPRQLSRRRDRALAGGREEKMGDRPKM